MRRSVLHLIGSFEIGGTERQALQLVRLLRDDKTYRVFVACLDANGPLGDEASRISSDAVPEYRLNSFYDVNFWTQIRRCVAFIKKREIGIIHTHDFYTNVFGMLAGFLASVPVRLASKRNTFSKTRNQLMVERQAFRAADRILVNADAVQSSLVEKGVPETKITKVYNGVDLAPFDAALSSRRAEILSKLWLEGIGGSQIVTMVANMSSDIKNHQMFLRSAATIIESYSDVAFVFAGEGRLAGSLKAEAAELGIDDRTYFLGRCDDVPGLLSVSDVCVLTSRTEGFSNSILEYMAAGKPVVATAVGGAAEAIAEGETGYLVMSDDSDAAADRILKLLQDRALAGRLGKQGRNRVERKFSVDVQLEKVRELYDSLLSAKRRITVRERA